MTDLIKTIKDWQENGTGGPWENETVKTSCGLCHRIGPFPAPDYMRKKSSAACIYDDYPPFKGSPELVANATLIAAAPDMAKVVLAALELDAVLSKYRITRTGLPADVFDAQTTFRNALEANHD